MESLRLRRRIPFRLRRFVQRGRFCLQENMLEP